MILKEEAFLPKYITRCMERDHGMLRIVDEVNVSFKIYI